MDPVKCNETCSDTVRGNVLQTWVGNALVSVNPCRALPLYSAELVRTYLARPPYTLPPHV